MDRKKSLLNVSFSILFKIILLVITILTRRVLIKTIGNDFNGLNSLFLSIIGFLSVAELGVGTAISFSMYKPIVEGDEKKVASLYNLFKKIYLVIGFIILAAGLLVLPFLPFLVADYSSVDTNIYFTFILMLVSVVITYAYSAKISLINAYKNNYITTCIISGGMLLQNILQIIVLFLTHSFIFYLLCRIVAAIIQWVATEVVTRIKYKTIISTQEKVDSVTKKEVTKNIKAMFMHKIGAVLVNSADSIIISAMIGVSILGKYSNYTTIVVALTGVLGLFFTPLTSVIGHMCASDNKETVKKYFNFFYVLNYFLGCVFFLGYFNVIDDTVSFLFGADLLLSKSISFTITLNYFIQFMRQSVLLFRDATGTFYNDRWKPLAEGVINIALSLLLVVTLPEDFKVVGVIIATILTNLFVCHIVEPLMLYKYGFYSSPSRYYVKNYLSIFAFSLCLVALLFLKIDLNDGFLSFLFNGFIAVGVSLIPIAVLVFFSPDFVFYFKRLFRHKRTKESE